MGLSSSKSSSKTVPVYSSQIEGAANNVNAAYSAQSPKISAITDQLGGLVPGLVERYTQGDPNVNAASGYNADVLSGKYLDAGNPYLQQQIDNTGNDVRNGLAASLGTRGLTGGSAFSDIISRNLANNSATLRFNDYNTERSRMDQAASQAGGIAAAKFLPISAISDIAGAQQMPLQAAAGNAASIGGLVGQYTNQTTKSSPSLASIIANMAANAAKAYAGG